MRNLFAAALVAALSGVVVESAYAQVYYRSGSIGAPGVTLWSGGGIGSFGYRYGYSYQTYFTAPVAYGYYGANYGPRVLAYAGPSTSAVAYAPPRMRFDRYAYTIRTAYYPVAVVPVHGVAPAVYPGYCAPYHP